MRAETPQLLGHDGRCKGGFACDANAPQAVGTDHDVQASYVSLSARLAVLLRHCAYLWLHWTRLDAYCFPRLSAVPSTGKRYHDTSSGCHTSITRFPTSEDFQADHGQCAVSIKLCRRHRCRVQFCSLVYQVSTYVQRPGMSAPQHRRWYDQSTRRSTTKLR